MDIDPILIESASTVVIPNIVTVHPLVLLSVVDHYYRVAKDTHKRVVGVLLGTWKAQNTMLDVTNSFALPFEEDDKDVNIWFLDHSYLENMWSMFRKVSAKERIIGWYHTGPKLHTSDLDINDVIKKFTSHPILVVIDVHYKEIGLPTDAYIAVEELQSRSKTSKWTFQHLPTEIIAEGAEEIGVEHLLRDIRDTEAGSLLTQISKLTDSLKALCQRLNEICDYLDKVSLGEFPINQEIIYNMQNVIFHTPELHELDNERLKALTIKGGDFLFILYISSLIRLVVAIHNLINNKITNREAEKKTEKSEVDSELRKSQQQNELLHIKKLAHQKKEK
jgi:26S proteasome regulatory subunit N8